MWKCIKPYFVCAFLILGLSTCFREKNKLYTYHSKGYYYRLISFLPTSKEPKRQTSLAHLALCYTNQKDSVFWDSYNNYHDLFVVSLAEADTSSILQFHILKSAVKDSFELLIPKATFFRNQFHTNRIPDFSQNDSIVKLRGKIKGFLSLEEFQSLSRSLERKEKEQIRSYFATENDFEQAKDSSGFYWVQRPSPWSPPSKFIDFDRIMLRYEGYFLTGRMFEKSKADFELIYGVPDQLIKGLNYVMPYLNEGQTAKIILPSALAFGEKGSSNGTVPPYTPVLYNIKLKEVKRK